VAEVAAQRDRRIGAPVVHRLESTGGRLATLVQPLDPQIAGQRLSFSARIVLAELASLVQGHPFVQRGEITLIDDSGRTVLEAEARLLADREIVA
jgi:adenylate cyclase